MLKHNDISCITCLCVAGYYFLSPPPVIAENSISFNSTAISPAITLTPNTELTDTLIGNVTIKSDSANGFTINAQSTNGGTLKRNSGEAIAYTLTYNGIQQGQITVTPKAVEDVISPICNSLNGCVRDLKIAFSKDAITAKPAGNYSDQLTFTLVTK
jgi:hypothetical protein